MVGRATLYLGLGLWLAALLPRALPLMCKIGYGQRGKNYENSIGWTRSCPAQSRYCFEALTFDVNIAKHIYEYPWDSYYQQFYVRSCGGDFNTSINYHPFKNLPKATRHKLGVVKLNLTIPKYITGQGGVEVEMLLSYKCKTNLCERFRSVNAATKTARGASVAAAVLALAASAFLLL